MKRASLSLPSAPLLSPDRALTDRQRRDLLTILTAVRTQSLRRARALALVTPRVLRASLPRRLWRF